MRAIQIIHTLCYRISCKFFRTVFPKSFHNALHLIHSGQSGEGEAVHGIQIVAILCIDFFQSFFNRGSILPVISRHLTNQHRCHYCILIPYGSSGEVAVALLKAEKKALFLSLFFQKLDLLSNPLESGKGMAHLDTIMLRYLICKRRADNGFHGNRILRKSSFRLSSGRNIIQKKNAHLISTD